MRDDQFVDTKFDLEQELIFHLLKRESLESMIRDGFDTDLIYAPKYKAAFSFARDYYSKYSDAPTPEVMHTEFPNINLAEADTPVDWVIEQLRERYQRNEIQDLTLALAQNVGTPDKAMEMLVERVMDIQRTSISNKYIYGPGDHKVFLSDLQDKIMAEQFKGLPIGFKAVDAFTGGLKPGWLAFLAARPKRQKTFHMLNTFIKQKQAGYRPFLNTLEVPKEEVMLRLSCMLSGYPWDLAHRGHIDAQGWKLLAEAWEEFDALGDHWISQPPVEERTVPAMLLQADKVDADSLLISQFRYIVPVNNYHGKPTHEKFAENVVDLKVGAMRPGKERPIYVEAQFNREGESIEEFSELGLGQLGLTDMIGQAADIVFALYQNKDMHEQQHTQFGIIESRSTDKKNWYIHSEFKKATRLELVS